MPAAFYTRVTLLAGLDRYPLLRMLSRSVSGCTAKRRTVVMGLLAGPSLWEIGCACEQEAPKSKQNLLDKL